MSVSVVITCWNGMSLLEKNFPTVLVAARNPKNKISEIIIVDDDSADNSVEYIRQLIKQNPEISIRLVKHPKNLGYAAVCNTGVKNALNDLVVILNLDVLPSENFLEYALPHFEDEKVFAVSFNEEKFGPGKIVWKNGFLEIVSTPVPNETTLTDWPSGGSSVFRKSLWEKLGGMDEIFLPFYFEDIDIGLRARKLGYKCLWEPKAKVIHQHESTINVENFRKYQRRQNVPLIKERNYLLLVWKNLDKDHPLKDHLKTLLGRFLKNPGYLKVVLLAFLRKLVFSFKNEEVQN